MDGNGTRVVFVIGLLGGLFTGFIVGVFMTAILIGGM